VGSFTTTAAGFIDPATNTLPGYGLTEVLLIDGATGQLLDKSPDLWPVTSRIIVHGRTLGGQDLQTAPWDFPIYGCNGCLCKEPADDTCVNPDAAPTDKCLIARDNPFDCRLLPKGPDGLGHTCLDPAQCGVFF
jgi:hypothetical protein